MGYSREPLPAGTRIQFLPGNLYRITGVPISFGGSGILYPAERLVEKNGEYHSFGLRCVIKECYPNSDRCALVRDPDTGRIQPQVQQEEYHHWLQQCQNQMLQESEIALQIYKSSHQTLPVLDYARQVRLYLPGKEPTTADNTVVAMESLTGKGHSLQEILANHRALPAQDAFRILQQLLLALQEIHEAGFLHLDIHDGNVFLQGSLTEGNSLTLIDFGCTRPLIDGKTAPITDRMILSTKGFSPPEMHLRNDGTLQLGPEADLFSAGCLLLTMLTGRVPNVRHFVLLKNPAYLTPRQAWQMKCPIYLYNRMQRFLARCLAPEPESRYHSAEEMLEEVSDLLTELRAKAPRRKSAFYDAFLCYRHTPAESAAAKALQEKLEGFHTPPGYPNLPRRPFRRVFMDEGELASCADFDNVLRKALENSAWLIVICSEETPASFWVEKEIKIFLETHNNDRSRILAVMTGGTPETAFPKILRKEVSGQELFAPSVPGSTPDEIARNIRKNTFLKIAAPMLGLDYEDLRQRYLTRMAKRAAAIAAAIILALSGFTAYAINRGNVIAWQAQRIQEEYETALRNESRFLTEQARERIGENDMDGALELLLQALPSETQPRPVLPQAEYLLGEVLGIYRDPGTAGGTMSAAHLLPAENSRFFLDDTGTYLFSWDPFGSVFQVWDTAAHSLLWEIPAEMTEFQQMFAEMFSELEHALTPCNDFFAAGEDFLLPDEAAVLLRVGGRILSFDYRQGWENWSVEPDNIITMALSEDKSCLAVLCGAQNDFTDNIPENRPIAMTLELFRADTGDHLESISFDLPANLRALEGLRFSPDGRRIALVAAEESSLTLTGTPHTSVLLIDLDSGEVQTLFHEESRVDALAFCGDRLALLHSGSTSVLWVNGTRQELESPEISVSMELYGLSDLQLQYSVERQGRDWDLAESRIHVLPREDRLLFQWQDRVLLLDTVSGQVLREYEFSAGIIRMAVYENGFLAVTSDGQMTVGHFDSDLLTAVSCFQNGVSGAYWQDPDVFYIQNSNPLSKDYTIRQFQWGRGDEQYRCDFRSEESQWSEFTHVDLSNRRLVLLAKENQLRLLDRETGESRCYDIPGFTVSGIQGLSEDETTLYWSVLPESAPENWLGTGFRSLDLRTGAVSRIMPPEKPDQETLFLQAPVYWHDGYYLITMQLQEANRLTLWYWDLREGTLEQVCQTSLPDSRDVCHMDSLTVSPEGNQVWFAAAAAGEARPNRLFLLDREDGSLTQWGIDFLPKAETDDLVSWAAGTSPWMAGCYRWNSSGDSVALGYEDTVYVLGEEGQIRYRIPVEEPVESCLFLPDGESLILASASCEISRWRISDGQCMGRISLSQYADQPETFRCFETDLLCTDARTLTLYTSGSGYRLDVSEDAPALSAQIRHCYDFDPVENRYLTANLSSADRVGSVGSYPRYTVEDLAAMARERLGR